MHILAWEVTYGKSEASLWRNLSTGTPPKFFSAILCFVALVYNYIFFRTAVLRKLFDIRFSYKHCNFSQVCLLVKMASKTMRGSICKINFSSLMFFGVTRSVWVYSTVERSSLACWQTDKVLFLFSNVKTEKLQRDLVNSKITNSISLPKLQEFCNENAATWRPSLLQSRYSYIIKRLVKTLNQPMTATLIRTTRSLKIYHRNWTDFCKGKNFRLGSHAEMLLLV